MSTDLRSREYDRLHLAFRDEIMSHLARKALSNYISAEELTNSLFAIMDSHGVGI